MKPRGGDFTLTCRSGTFGIADLKLEIADLKFRIADLKCEIVDLKFRIGEIDLMIVVPPVGWRAVTDCDASGYAARTRFGVAWIGDIVDIVVIVAPPFHPAPEQGAGSGERTTAPPM
jgi:hypothetical protein